VHKNSHELSSQLGGHARCFERGSAEIACQRDVYSAS